MPGAEIRIHMQVRADGLEPISSKATLYLAPNSVPDDRVVTINPILDDITTTFGAKAAVVGYAYDFEPREVKINRNKPATMSISLCIRRICDSHTSGGRNRQTGASGYTEDQAVTG